MSTICIETTTAALAIALRDAESNLQRQRDAVSESQSKLDALRAEKVDIAPLQNAVDQATSPEETKLAVEKITAAYTANAVAHLKSLKEREPLELALQNAKRFEAEAIRELELADQSFRSARLADLESEKERMQASFQAASQEFMEASAR